MTKVAFKAAVARVDEIERAMMGVPEEAYSLAIDKMFVRELEAALKALGDARVATPEDGKALVQWLCRDEAACGQPQLLRKILPVLKAA